MLRQLGLSSNRVFHLLGRSQDTARRPAYVASVVDGGKLALPSAPHLIDAGFVLARDEGVS